MLQSYDSKMKEALARRDLAQTRLRLATQDSVSAVENKINAVKAELTQKVDGFTTKIDNVKSSLTPKNIVQGHPWGAAAGVAVFGLLLAPLLKNLFAPRRSRHAHHTVQHEPQRVVVEVVGANPPQKKKRGAALGAMFTALMQHLPQVAAFAQQHLHAEGRHNGNGQGAEQHEEVEQDDEPASPVPNPPAQHPSISRRTAPPPP